MADGSQLLASDEQLAAWVEKFGPYRKAPTKSDLLEWLERFDPADLPAARKLLDAVIIVSELEVQQGYRDALANLAGWSPIANSRAGRWYFVGVGSAGESGPAMLRLFREANNLQADRWQSFFVTTKELPALNLSAFDHVVFVDDFAGTGGQIVTYWPIMEELIASEATCYLILTAVTSAAAQEISAKTDLHLLSRITLNRSENIFSEECLGFDASEKEALERYGKIAWKDRPRGFGDCGLALVLSHKTPNNTVPILHANHQKWIGPFPRTLIQAA